MHRKWLKESVEWRAWGWLWMNPQPVGKAAGQQFSRNRLKIKQANTITTMDLRQTKGQTSNSTEIQ